VVLTVGRSEASRRASAAHTGALASEARVVDAFLDSLGVIVVRDLDELVEVVELASFVPRVGSGVLAVTTISGGGCAVLADLAHDVGLPLSSFSPAVDDALRAAIPGDGTIGNPVDLTGLATDDESILAGALLAMDGEPRPDTGLHLFAVNTPLAATEEDRDLYRRMVATVVRTAPGLRSPVALLTLTSGALDPALVDSAHGAGIPLMQGGREALNAVAKLHAVTARQGDRAGEPVTVTARAAVATAKLSELAGATVPQSTAAGILRAAGIAVAAGEVVATADRALDVAADLGYPVVAKIESPDIVHKTDAGCVLLDLRSPAEVRSAVATILERAGALGARIDGVRIEKQVADGVAVLLGVIVDPRLGPAVVLGAGGIYTEVLDDVAILLAPVAADEVRSALRGLRVNQLLAGARGQQPADVDALVEAVVALSEFAWAARDEIAAIDVNPVIVHAQGDGVTAVDAVLLRRAEQSTTSAEPSARKEAP
jgi:acyl-CoA synthetase (NDP forming)